MSEFEDMLQILISSKSLSPEAAQQYRQNAENFNKDRTGISDRCRGQYVAVLGDKVLSSPNFAELKSSLDMLIDGDLAYIEQLPA